MDVNLKVVACAQDAFSEKILRLGFFERALENPCPIGHFTTDVDIRQMHVVGETGNHHPLDQLVCILIDDLPVLEGARLRFVRVAYQVDRLAATPVNKRPFKPAGKSCTTSPAQTGNFNIIANLLLG